MYTPFHLDAVRPLPPTSVAVGAHHVGRLILVGSDYKAFGLADALETLANQRGLGEVFDAPELVCLPRPELLKPPAASGGRDLWLLHTAVLEWDEANAFARAVKDGDPTAGIVLLSDDRRAIFARRRRHTAVDRVFIWAGQPDGLLALIWLFRDALNAEQEMAQGLPLLLLVEDKPVHFSSFVPRIYREIVERTQAITGTTSPELLRKHLKMRPRILLAETFEDALVYLGAYFENLIGIISDCQFPAGRELHPTAGFVLTESARCVRPTVPIVLQSSDPAIRDAVQGIKAHFLFKRSDRWLSEVRRLMLDSFGFGDFIFREADEREIARAATIRELRDRIAEVSLESFEFHARRYHFSTWLYIHGAHELARQLRPIGGDAKEVRTRALDLIGEYIKTAS